MSDDKDSTKTDSPGFDESAQSSTADTAIENAKHDPWTENSGKSEEKADEKIVSQAEQASAKKPGKAASDLSKQDWERDLINRLAFSAINEQRRTRRWNVFFKSAFLLYILGILVLYFPKDTGEIHIGSHTALVELSGPIADNAFANADTMITGLRDAYKDKNTKAVILRINSPGGSPVHAGYINDEIWRLREKYPNIPLYAVVTDICASAAYYIAAAANEIYADKTSIVGSIGVLMDGYGFVGTMEKLGVERRLLTAGKNKAFLDPFSPMKEEHKQFMQGMLSNIHDQFVNVVKKGRGDRLHENPDLFTGLVWSGEKSVDLGLIDGLGSVSYVAREIVGQEKIVDFTPRPNYLDRFAERIGVASANALSSLLTSMGTIR